MPAIIVFRIIFNLHHAVGDNGNGLMGLVECQNVPAIAVSGQRAGGVLRLGQIPRQYLVMAGILRRKAKILRAVFNLLRIAVMRLMRDIQFHY